MFRQLFKFWLPVFVWSSLIFILSSFPTIETSGIYWQDFIFKKTAHFIEYFIYAVILYRAIKSTNMDTSKVIYYTLFISIIYAASDEIHQSFVPNREPRIRDVIIDSFGALTALVSIHKLLPTLPKAFLYYAKKLSII